MKYFTPELFLEINSADDVVADAAMGRHGRRQFKITDGIYPHLLRDACRAACNVWRGCLFTIGNSSSWTWRGVILRAVVMRDSGWCYAMGKERLILFYLLWDKIKRSDAPAACRFSKKRVHWLYDELDSMADRRGRFVHRILLSNGEMLSIPFFGSLCGAYEGG